MPDPPAFGYVLVVSGSGMFRPFFCTACSIMNQQDTSREADETSAPSLHCDCYYVLGVGEE